MVSYLFSYATLKLKNFMKTICFINSKHDHAWITDYLNQNSGKEEITIIATSFEGQITAQVLNIACKTYEDEVLGIGKDAIVTLSRRQAYYWHQLPELKTNPKLEAVRMFKDYPLLTMHFLTFNQGFQVIHQSYELVIKIISNEKPDKIILGRCRNPFDIEASPPFNMAMLDLITSSTGLEYEAIKGLSKNRHIEIIEMPAQPYVESGPTSDITTTNSLFLEDVFVWDSRLTGPKILIFAWSGHYLLQISETFDYLLKNKYRIGLVIVGGKLTFEEENEFKRKNILITYKSDWPVENEANLLREWRVKGKDAFESISENKELENFFSKDYDGESTVLFQDAINANLTKYIPYTVIELARAENIISAANPDLVFTHFARHPWELCDALPARQFGIPTLTICHGATTSYEAPDDTYATQYYAVPGRTYKEALAKVQPGSQESVFSVGNCRFDNIKTSNLNIKEVKASFGLNPEAPLCIFCDASGWNIASEKRHSTHRMVKQILALKKNVPVLQIIYRIHHGLQAGYFMKEVFDYSNIAGVSLQISPFPPFDEIIQAADLVIAHHSSAIAESLLYGVKVIYLTALASVIEYDNYYSDAIKVVDNFDNLAGTVREILENPMPRESVRMMARPYFDNVLCGADGKANERLSRLILELAETPKEKKRKGFEDWIGRIDAACKSQMSDANAYYENKPASLVSNKLDNAVMTYKTKMKKEDGDKERDSQKEDWYSNKIEQLSSASKGQDITSIFDAINKLKASGRLDEACIVAKKAVSEYSESIELLNMYAALIDQNGNRKECKRILLEIMKREPDNFDTLISLSAVDSCEGSLPNAAEFLKHALIMAPDNKSAQIKLSEINKLIIPSNVFDNLD